MLTKDLDISHFACEILTDLLYHVWKNGEFCYFSIVQFVFLGCQKYFALTCIRILTY